MIYVSCAIHGIWAIGMGACWRHIWHGHYSQLLSIRNRSLFLSLASQTAIASKINKVFLFWNQNFITHSPSKSWTDLGSAPSHKNGDPSDLPSLAALSANWFPVLLTCTKWNCSKALQEEMTSEMRSLITHRVQHFLGHIGIFNLHMFWSEF